MVLTMGGTLLCGLSQSAYYYKTKKASDEEIKKELLLLAKAHPRRGFGKMFHCLRKQGLKWNHKRVYRVYCELKLNLRIKAKKRFKVVPQN